MEVDKLINNRGNLQVEQDATLQLMQQNGQMLQAMQKEDGRRWDAWFLLYLPPQ
jgi:hypothetical protein